MPAAAGQCWTGEKPGRSIMMKPNPTVAFAPWVPVCRRYVRFCIVGGSGVLVDMVVLFLLASPMALGWNISLAKAVAAEAAILSNYTWNDLWTFRGRSGRRWRSWLAGLGRFNLVCVAGIGWSVLLLNAGVYGLGSNLYAANGAAIVLVSLWNFLLSERYAWKTDL